MPFFSKCRYVSGSIPLFYVSIRAHVRFYHARGLFYRAHDSFPRPELLFRELCNAISLSRPTHNVPWRRCHGCRMAMRLIHLIILLVLRLDIAAAGPNVGKGVLRGLRCVLPSHAGRDARKSP